MPFTHYYACVVSRDHEQQKGGAHAGQERITKKNSGTRVKNKMLKNVGMTVQQL